MVDNCTEFASQNAIEFSTRKTIVLHNALPGKTIDRKPNVYFKRQVLTYVNVFMF